MDKAIPILMTYRKTPGYGHTQNVSFTPKAGRPSLRQFARLAGVSPATVSRVFSDNHGLVATNTREHILRLADACGFYPTAINRVSFGGSTNSIGILVPNLSVSYYAEIMVGLQKTLLEVDVLPMVLQSGGDDEGRSLRRLLDHRVDAMVLVLRDASLNLQDFAESQRSNIPILLIDTQQAAAPCDILLSDDIQGGRLAAEHLVGLGHREIGYCSLVESPLARQNDFLGITQALQEHGLKIQDKNIARMTLDDEGRVRLREDIRNILARKNRPTAFCAHLDGLAVDIYRAAQDLGLRIPEDLSVVGYADLEYASYLSPPLTTIRQDGLAMGKHAGEMLLERLREPAARHQIVQWPTQLIVRGSTAAPPILTQK